MNSKQAKSNGKLSALHFSVIQSNSRIIKIIGENRDIIFLSTLVITHMLPYMVKIVNFQMDAPCLRSCIPRFSLENWYYNDDELLLLCNDNYIIGADLF